MEAHDVRVFADAAAFRSWLEEHHATVSEQWVGFYRKGASKSAMSYPEAVEEALCFGWIDGQMSSIDDELRAIRFTPRRRTSSWSAKNIDTVARLTAEGRMHQAGRRAFDERDRRKDQVYSYERPPMELAPEFLDRFRADPAAWSHWESETPSYRRTATYWVMEAKKPETRERRFADLVARSAEGTRPRPFLVARAERGVGR
ncbi:MAG TPA: YdeI/OmpD-associated family protein [Candidatus Limnocylindria bacterium]|nr:YdeI/OmpD-associated family protein [Candidatus Limnocylindria bacterium]